MTCIWFVSRNRHRSYHFNPVLYYHTAIVNSIPVKISRRHCDWVLRKLSEYCLDSFSSLWITKKAQSVLTNIFDDPTIYLVSRTSQIHKWWRRWKIEQAKEIQEIKQDILL